MARYPRLPLSGFLAWSCLAILAAVRPAAADLQLLALVATDGPVALACERDNCSADFSALCLQAERRAPEAGEAYRLHQGGRVRLVGIAADGGRIALPAEELLAAHVLRTHVAVRLSVPRSRASEAGLIGFEVEVGDTATLLPVAGGQSPEAIALATGPLRQVAARLVDTNRHGMAAARLTQRLINALPEGRETAAQRATVWQDTVAGRAGQQEAAAVDLARATHDRCRDASAAGLFSGMRSCLGSPHDAMLGDLNKSFWDALKAGS